MYFIFFADDVPASHSSKKFPPVIREDPADASVLKQSPATLKCKADGNPKPDILWFKDGRPFPGPERPEVLILEDGSSLFFLDVGNDDVGVYWCVARNSEGASKSQNATLVIAREFPL